MQSLANDVLGCLSSDTNWLSPSRRQGLSNKGRTGG